MSRSGELVFPVMPIPIQAIPIMVPGMSPSPGLMMMTPPAASPPPNFLTPGLLSTPTPSPSPGVSQQLRRCVFDPKVRTAQHTMVLDQIFDAIRSQGRKDYDIELPALATALGGLILRMRKTAMEMIYEYHQANPSKVHVMGRPSDVPYRGIHNKTEDYLEFNLAHFPDSLVIALYEFVLMIRINQPASGQTTPNH